MRHGRRCQGALGEVKRYGSTLWYGCVYRMIYLWFTSDPAVTLQVCEGCVLVCVPIQTRCDHPALWTTLVLPRTDGPANVQDSHLTPRREGLHWIIHS